MTYRNKKKVLLYVLQTNTRNVYLDINLIVFYDDRKRFRNMWGGNDANSKE